MLTSCFLKFCTKSTILYTSYFNTDCPTIWTSVRPYLMQPCCNCLHKDWMNQVPVLLDLIDICLSVLPIAISMSESSVMSYIRLRWAFADPQVSSLGGSSLVFPFCLSGSLRHASTKNSLGLSLRALQFDPLKKLRSSLWGRTFSSDP